MIQKHYVFGGKVNAPMIIKINTNLGTGASFTIPTTTTPNITFDVDWGDGIKTFGHFSTVGHNYSSHGIYTIKIYRRFQKFYFNNGGDRLKVTEIISWGNTKLTTNQTGAFFGCNNLNAIPNDVTFLNTVTNGVNMFRLTALTNLPAKLTLESLIIADAMFNGTPITSLSNDISLENLTSGQSMFFGTALTSLPQNILLDKLTTGTQMFSGLTLTSLPVNMKLDNLVTGTQMFANCKITSLPIGMKLNKLVTGSQMFLRNTPLAQIPNLILSELVNGESMFSGCTLTSLPEAINLNKLVSGGGMFGDNNLTELPSTLIFASLRDAAQMLVRNREFTGNVVVTGSQIISINGMFFNTRFNHDISGWDYSKDVVLSNSSFNPNTMNYNGYSPEFYSNFLIKIRNTVVGTGRTAGNKYIGFNCKYLPYAASARADLVADGWDVRDTGMLI